MSAIAKSRDCELDFLKLVGKLVSGKVDNLVWSADEQLSSGSEHCLLFSFPEPSDK